MLAGNWPDTLEECFGIEQSYAYPLCRTDAKALTDYFIHEFAPSKSLKNELDKFEGFVFEGPEYLTMFAGDGRELQTIPFKYGRVDDGLMWGDYAMKRIEPCNRVDRFLSGVAYLDGKRPYLIVCRGYYTRVTMVAYDFFEGRFREYFSIDSGFVPMKNPFHDNPHAGIGTDPVYGILAGQGNHSLSTADVDGDGCQEIIYGAAVIDHDGSVLYSGYDYLPDGRWAKLGHGDIMLVPEDTATNNGTKGNACLVADLFADFREELVLRKADDSAIRIYTNVDVTEHKLFTLMHDIQYRTSVAWQNNCYNQPGYTSFYYGNDMDWKQVFESIALV